MAHALEITSDWLKGKIGKTLNIRKEEQDDRDEVHLILRKVDYRDASEGALDSYTSGSTLKLRGDGEVLTEGHEAELPSGAFDLPLEGLQVIESDPRTLIVENERARYRLTVKE